jgi:hypothetical protein
MMRSQKILSALFVMLALALSSLSASGCSSPGDMNSSGGSAGGSSSSGGSGGY